MRTLLTLALFLPVIASAQSSDPAGDIFRQYVEQQYPTQPQQVYGLPVQPVLPVPQDNGPWGTGYSVVTNSRPTRNLYDRDMVGSETVQRIVPNDALGQPMRGLDPLGW